MDEDEITVSEAMIAEGYRVLFDGGAGMSEYRRSLVTDAFRAMVRVQRAEATDDVIRRSVRDGMICEHGKHVLRDPPCKECVSEIDKFRRRGAD